MLTLLCISALAPIQCFVESLAVAPVVPKRLVAHPPSSPSHKLNHHPPRWCHARNVRLWANDSNNDEEEELEIPSASNDLKSAVVTGLTAPTSSRRSALLRMAAIPSAAAVLVTSTAFPPAANAGKPEIDELSGELFTPKAQMLGGGGSDAARGIKIQSRDRSRDTTSQSGGQKRSFVKTGPIQTVYDARFIAYLSRFILNFDPAARSWWLEQVKAKSKLAGAADPKAAGALADADERLRFAEFAESVEVGLADYFVGPYGSYASIQAAKAGLNAAAPATSGGVVDSGSPFPDFSKVIGGLGSGGQGGGKTKGKKKKKKKADKDRVAQKRQGILNLLTLLKTRYTSLGAKSQLAILFSLIDDADLQPTAEIKGLLGEVDDASVDALQLDGLPQREERAGENDFRRSSRQGGGYSFDSPPKIEVEPPPALGVDYRRATLKPIMKPSTRILRINILDGGEGYRTPPSVTVSQGGVRRKCDAAAILDRDGCVESIIVLDPGLGYGGGGKGGRYGRTVAVVPTVEIAPPKSGGGGGKQGGGGSSGDGIYRQAQAVAELEYAISDIEIVDKGSGYVTTQPPKISIPPCEEDPEWFVSVMTYKDREENIAKDKEFIKARVTSMKKGFYNTTVDTSTATAIRSQIEEVDSTTLDRIKEDALSVLPSTIRPELEDGIYRVPSLPPLPEQPVALPSQRYRAIDPFFGGVGTKPVTIGAKELSISEYSRLALSGAVCTVLVRTLLNPLELVKTKIQLQNDEELMTYAKASVDEPTGGAKQSSKRTAVAVKERKAASNAKKLETVESEKEESKIGTLDLIQSLIKLRGPFSLFQSADITFLASLVFGSLGFGATELFRRSFSNIFFDTGTGGGAGSEFVLLGAAALACIITSAAAAPFEIIRVQSMGKVEAQGWTLVLADFLAEKRQARGESNEVPQPVLSGGSAPTENDAFNLRDIKKEDIKPLFSGFPPIVSRELPFAITKFLVFDLLARAAMQLINSQPGIVEPVQVGVGTIGLLVSALAGALAGIAGAIISHPADLILTLTSTSKKKGDPSKPDEEEEAADWRSIVQELLEKEGGIGNLFVGLPARASFFFLVIGLQFFLYDYVKGLFQVSPDDLTLILDVFYAIRQGL